MITLLIYKITVMRRMVKRNYGLNCFQNLDESLFEYAYEHNLTCLEIHLDKNYTTLESFTDSKIERLNQLAAEKNVQLALHNMHTVNIADIIPYYRNKGINYLREVIRLANLLDTFHVTMHIGNFYWFPVEKWTRKKALNRFIKSVDSIIEECEKKNVCFALENVVPLSHNSEYYYLGDQLEDFHYLFSHLDSKYFQLCLDTGHANVGEGVLEYLNNFGSKLLALHFHDNNGYNDEHLPVGEGTIDWKSVTAKLKELNFNGPMISETGKIKPHEAAKKLDDLFNNKCI